MFWAQLPLSVPQIELLHPIYVLIAQVVIGTHIVANIVLNLLVLKPNTTI